MDRYLFTNEQRQLMESMRVPFAIYQFINHRVVTLILSDGFCKLFGYDDRALAYHIMDHDMYVDVHPEDAAGTADAALRFAREEDSYDVLYRSKVPGSECYRVIHAIGEHVYLDNGVRLAYVWYTDEGSTADKPLRESCLLAPNRYDRLTGLPNMSYFFELAEADRHAVLSTGQVPVLLFLDLSGMKYYNSRHSFTEGDKLLAAFARLLAGTFGNENCCHIAADHFAVFTQAQGLEEILARLFREWQQQNGESSLPIRVGAYLNDTESVPISTACDRAKIACDSLRRGYASNCQFYDKTLQDSVEKRQYILSNLDRALEQHWIQVYYQPIIRAVTGRVCDEEALARWVDPVHGFLSPAEFIPFLEDAGLIYKLDLYVLDQVLAKMNRQRELGFPVIPHSVNLSRSDFDKCDIVEEIRRRVDAAAIGRDKITIEITESVIGSDFAFMKEQVERFQSLGFPVWMDDFGSGYSSMDVLQSIHFDLLKFDMSFMRKLDEGGNGKIVLTELMRLASALGADTLCEGVETAAQVSFLQDIGCAKLQGYYYTKPLPLEKILDRYERGIQIGYENPRESDYYETIGRVNLYDLAVLASEDISAMHNVFNMLPMGIMEINGDRMQFVRANESYRAFMKRFFGFDLTQQGKEYAVNPFGTGSGFMRLVNRCCNGENRVFFDEKMPDGSTVHSFARRIGANPVKGTIAVAVAVLSITDESEGASYSDIARALAADYYNLYYVDLVTEDFIEYSSPMGREELAMERHGKNFFKTSLEDVMTRVYEPDRESFLSDFNRETILRRLDEQGVFVLTYRLLDKGEPIYVTMKVMRMSLTDRHIIIGISVTDQQMKQKEADDKLRQENVAFGRIAALSGGYIVLYTVDPSTDRYFEYSASEDFQSLGLAKEGDDFFGQGLINGRKTVYADDLPKYQQLFARDTILRAVKDGGLYRKEYRLMLNGEIVPVSLHAALVRERDGEKLIVGVRRRETENSIV